MVARKPRAGFWQILVLPEKTARAWENGEIQTRYIPDDLVETGTLYNVNINVKNASNKADLLTFKVGNTPAER